MNINNTIILEDLKETTINNTVRELALKLNEEVQELFCELVLENDEAAIKQEIADVYIVLAQVAKEYNFTEFDLVDKLEDVKKRYLKEGE